MWVSYLGNSRIEILMKIHKNGKTWNFAYGLNGFFRQSNNLSADKSIYYHSNELKEKTTSFATILWNSSLDCTRFFASLFIPPIQNSIQQHN